MGNDILSEIIAVEKDIQERLVAEERSAGTMLCSLRQDIEEAARREEERLAAARREAESSARAEAEERAAAIMRQAVIRAEQWSALDDRTRNAASWETLSGFCRGKADDCPHGESRDHRPQRAAPGVIALVRELGIFQIEPDITCFVTADEEEKIRSLNLDEKSVAERIFFEDLKARIDELFACLPQVEIRESYLDPGRVLDSVAATVQQHRVTCGEWCRKREALHKELAELSGYAVFLVAIEPLLARMNPRGGLDFIGVTIKDPAALEELMRVLARLTQGKFELLTVKAEDGTLIDLITLEQDLAEKVRHTLGDQHVPELTFPAALADLPFPEKIRTLRARIAEVNSEIAAIDRDLTQFALRWGAIYQGVRRWLAERLALHTNMAYLHQTGMCFFIHGWTPAAEVARLRDGLDKRFGGAVIVEEKRSWNRILTWCRSPCVTPPIPAPSSCSPGSCRCRATPPWTRLRSSLSASPLFFGMILGDAGYGLVLLVLALILAQVYRKRDIVRDAAKILFISACYTIVFGIFYGECFGELGARLLGMEGAFIVERRLAIIPMLYFALSVGMAHVTLGLLLGFVTAVKRKTGREALYKLVSIFVMGCLVVLFLSVSDILPRLLTKPLTVALLFLIPVLFFAGGYWPRWSC